MTMMLSGGGGLPRRRSPSAFEARPAQVRARRAQNCDCPPTGCQDGLYALVDGDGRVGAWYR